MNLFTYFSIKRKLKKALSACQAGDSEQTFDFVIPILLAKDVLTQRKIWQMTWKQVGEIFHLTGESLLSHSAIEVADLFDQPKQLYHVGFDLIDAGQYVCSLPILKRAALLVPDDELIVSELAHAFEELEFYDEAKRWILQSQYLVNQSFMCRYLLVFYSFVLGDLEEAKKWYNGLEPLLETTPAELRFGYENMFHRAQAMVDGIPNSATYSK